MEEKASGDLTELVQAEVDKALEVHKGALSKLEGGFSQVQADVNELREALTVEFLQQTSEQGVCREVYVCNSKSGIVHRARLGQGSRSVGIGSTAEPSGALAAVSLPALPGEGTQERIEDPELSAGTAQCGWPFSIGFNAVMVQELPSLYKDLCERCFTSLRGARKWRLLGSGGAGCAEWGTL